MFFKKTILLIIILLVFLSLSCVSANEIDNVTINDLGIQDDFANQSEYSLEYENVVASYSSDNVENSSIESSNNNNALNNVLSFSALQTLIQVGGTVTLMNDYAYDQSTDKAVIHNGMGIVIATPTVIEGNGHSIDARFSTIIFRLNAADFTFRNVVFMNAISQNPGCRDNIVDGGAIRLMNGRLNLVNCTFTNNKAYGSGGAIYVGPNSNLEISMCTFNSNSADNGGAISAEEHTEITLRSSTFTGNGADNWGGAVCGDKVYCERSKFSRNQAKEGGAINAGQGLFDYVSFTNNTATEMGGAFCTNSDEKLSVVNNLICRGNQAKLGGALYVLNGTSSDSKYSDNVASQDGGAIYSKCFGMKECVFENNRAFGYGGAARVNTFKDFMPNQYYVFNCKFINNRATRSGGAVYTFASYEDSDESGSRVIKNNYFDGNSAGDSGNHLYVGTSMSSEVKIQYNVFVNNRIGGSALLLPSASNIQYNWWGTNTPIWSQIGINRAGIYTQDENYVMARLNYPRVVQYGDFETMFTVNFVSLLGQQLSDTLYGIDVNFNSTTGYFPYKNQNGNSFSAPYIHTGRTSANIIAQINNQRLSTNILVNGTSIWMNILDNSGKYILAAIALGGIAATGYLIYGKYLSYADSGNNGDGTEDNPAGTIQQAVDNAQDGDIIILMPGNYSGEGNVNVNINKKLTIISPDYGDVIIDAEGKSPIFNINANTCNIYGLVFKNAKGSAINFNNDVSNSIINATFINNTGDYGGAIEFKKLSINNIIEGIFLNNTGYSLYFYKNHDNLISNSIFDTSSNVIYSNNPIKVDSSWFANVIPDNVFDINATMSNMLFLNCTYAPYEFNAGDKLNIHFDLYSYDFNSKTVSKYNNKIISDILDLKLLSNDGLLSKNSVKLGEEFTFTPNSASSSLDVCIGQSVNTFDFSKKAINLSTINAKDIVKVYKNDTQFEATFFDSKGQYLEKGSEVSFTINGVTYNRKINNDKGIASLNINLPSGEYNIISTNHVTGENTENSVGVISTVLSNDLIKYYRNDSQFVVQVRGSDGNIVGAGEVVTFNINGVVYTKTTNETGHAKLNINLNPDDYIITTQYHDECVSNHISVKSILVNQLYSYNDSSYTIKLLDSKGNPYSNCIVKFNINGVFYNSITDNYGFAKLKLNLMKGIYIITSMYGGLSASEIIMIGGIE